MTDAPLPKRDADRADAIADSLLTAIRSRPPEEARRLRQAWADGRFVMSAISAGRVIVTFRDEGVELDCQLYQRRADA